MRGGGASPGRSVRRLVAVIALTALAACDGIYLLHGVVRSAPCDQGAPLRVEGARVGAVRNGRVLYATRTNDHGDFRLALPSAPRLDKVRVELEVVKEGCRTEKLVVDALPANVEGRELELVLDCACPVPAS